MLRTLALVVALSAVRAPPPVKTPQPKGKAPVSNEILRVKLPRPAEADLSNGLHLIVMEDRRLPQISFEIIIPGRAAISTRRIDWASRRLPPR